MKREGREGEGILVVVEGRIGLEKGNKVEFGNWRGKCIGCG